MSDSLNRRAFFKWFVTVSIGASLLLTWLYTGIVFSYVDEETKSSFFLKKYPSFKIKFYNLDDSDSDYIPFPQLSPEARNIVAEYCKYRFGVLSTDAAQIEACRETAERVAVESRAGQEP
jgi:hypothetical protein